MTHGIKLHAVLKLSYRILKHTAILLLCFAQLNFLVSPVFAQDQLYLALPSAAAVQSPPPAAPSAMTSPQPPSAMLSQTAQKNQTQTSGSGSIQDAVASFLSTVVTLNNPVHLVNPPAGFERAATPEFTLSIPEQSSDAIGSEKTRQWQTGNQQITAAITDSSGNQYAAIIKKTDQGQFELFPDTNNLTPGNYTIQINAKESFFYTRHITQNFSWGVLALNTDKSMYFPGDTVNMSIGIIDHKGYTQCNSVITMTVTNPQGQTTNLSTEDDSILRSSQCLGDTYSAVPDYTANYSSTSTQGNYTIIITATTQAGSFSISDNFTVSNNIPFDVQRVSFPTRVYPMNPYTGKFIIKPHANFTGNVVESVPVNFTLNSISDNGVQTVAGNRRLVTWSVNWISGQTYILSYGIHFPVKSPAYYLLGPLKIGNIFQEARQWEVANDAVICWNGASNGANWSVNTNWSGNVLPGSADIATFGGCGGSNANGATIDSGVTVNVAGIAIASAYTGTISQGAGANPITIGSSGFSQVAGTFQAGSNTINDAGNFSVTAGTFTAQTSTVNFNTSGQSSVIAGSNTFYTLSSTTASKNIAFTAGSTTTVTNRLTIGGSPGSNIRLQSTSTGSPWYILDNGTQSLSNLSVSDSDACGGSTTPLNTSQSTNVSNNYCWSFSSRSWYNSAWQYRMPITINYSQVAATLTNFPVLIALTNNSNLGSNVAIPSTGQDIIFTDDTGVTPLNYEIEYYANSGTPTVGTLDAWVNIPYLSNTQNTTIYMYYGNASAPANITNYATWIASIYDAVYHLNNLSLVNSAPTGNQNNLTNNGATNNAYPNSAIAGGAGCSITPGTGKFLSNAAAAGLPSTTAPQTLSAWAYFNTGEAPYATTQQNDNENLVDTFNATTTAAVQLGFRSQEYITWRYGGTALVQCTGTVPPANQWNYYVYTYDGTTDRLYLNGTQCNSTTVTNAVSSVPLDDGVCSYPGGQEYWVGNIDEPRVESGARSANWILTEYNNQNPSTQSSFFSVGTQSQNSTANVVIQGDTRIRGGTKIQ